MVASSKPARGTIFVAQCRSSQLANVFMFLLMFSFLSCLKPNVCHLVDLLNKVIFSFHFEQCSFFTYFRGGVGVLGSGVVFGTLIWVSSCMLSLWRGTTALASLASFCAWCPSAGPVCILATAWMLSFRGFLFFSPEEFSSQQHQMDVSSSLAPWGVVDPFLVAKGASVQWGWYLLVVALTGDLPVFQEG